MIRLPFDRKALRGALIAVPVVLAWLALAPSSASAFSCALDTESSNDGVDPGALLGGGGSSWETDDNDGDFADATLIDRDLGFSRYDAFDGYGTAKVNATPYDNPDLNNEGCQLINGGHGLRYPTYTGALAGLNVTPTVFASPKRALGRQVVFLKNTTGAPLTFDFTFDGDLGSDSNTNVDRTSSGNGLVEPRDVWATSCEDVDTDGCKDIIGERFRDPELAHNWERRGPKPDSADLITFADGDGNFDVAFNNVTIPAGKTFAYMEVVSLYRGIDGARGTVDKIGTHPGDLDVFQGLTNAQQAQLRNW